MQGPRTLPRALALAIFLLVCVYAALGGDRFNIEEHLGTKRRYPTTTRFAEPVHVPNGCRLVQLHMFVRHGGFSTVANALLEVTERK